MATENDTRSDHRSQTSPAKGFAVGNVSFSYGDRAIFRTFSLASSRNRVVLKGPSGCGKTTLLRILFGSLPVNSGAKLPTYENSVLVLQEDALFPWLTGRANVCRLIGSPSIDDHPLFATVADFIDRRAFRMSYGQRRAIELFRAIIYKPSIIYLDEPFNYLDDVKAAAFIAALIETSESSSQLVITTHRHDHSLDRESDVFTFVGEAPYSSLAHAQ